MQAQVLDATSVPQVSPFYKINVDGATFSTQKEVRVGMLIRDDGGRVIAALRKKIKALIGALES